MICGLITAGYTTPKLLAWQLEICFLCSTTAKTNHIDSTKPAPLSMNELADSTLIIGILIGLGFRL